MQDALSLQLHIVMLSIYYPLSFVQPTLVGCCDVIAQFILVRILNIIIRFIQGAKSSKIYRCWLVWGKNIRVIIIPSLLAITYICQLVYLHLTKRFQLIPSTSYLASFRWLRKTTASESWNFWGCLGMEVDSNSFGRDHGREHPGDGLDRIQDPQGVLASQANIGTRRETQLLKYHIHNNRIWNGVVCHSPGSHRAYQPVSSESASFKGYCFSFRFSGFFPTNA